MNCYNCSDKGQLFPFNWRDGDSGNISGCSDLSWKAKIMPVLKQLSQAPEGTSFLLITCGANYLEGFKADVGAWN